MNTDLRKDYLGIVFEKHRKLTAKERVGKALHIPLTQYLVFAAVLVSFYILMQGGAVTSSFVFAIGNTMIYAIMAIGFCLLMGYSGLASLGTAGFVGIGAYIAFYLVQEYGYTFGMAFIVTVAVAIVTGIMVGFISLRIEGIYLAILTLGLSEILRNTFISLKSSIKIDMSKIQILGAKIGENEVYLLILLVFVVLLWITSNLIHSPVGRALLSVKNSSSAAQAMGINLMKYRVLAFVISTIYAAIAGLLYMMYLRNMTTSTSTLLAMTTSLNILGAVVIGGAKSLWGTSFGVFIIYGLQSTLLSKIAFFVENPAFITMLTGLMIILIVMFFPGGIAQMASNLARKYRESKLRKNVERRIEAYGRI